MEPLRVVLIDRMTAFRELLAKSLLAATPPYFIIGQSTNCTHIQKWCVEDKADLLVFEPEACRGSAFEMLRGLLRDRPTLRILLVADGRTAELANAIEAGAHGSVLRAEPLEQLEMALRVVTSGGIMLSTGSVCQSSSPTTLTKRQQAILQLIASGLSTKELAHQLKISFKTADHHRTKLMKKFHVHDSISLLKQAVRHGYVEF